MNNSVDYLRGVQLKSLEIFKVFSEFCNERGLRYFLCGGSLIGAVRHKGFVPWDDDIDLFMFRSDYEKLASEWELYNNNGDYSMLRTTHSIFCDTMLTQFSDNNTTFIKSNLAGSDINHGLKIEIIPLDAAPNSWLQRKAQMFWAIVFCLYNRGFAPENKGALAHMAGLAALKLLRSPEKRYRAWRFAEKQMSKYPISDSTKNVTELCVTYKYMKNLYPIEIFSSQATLKFESLPICAPAGYHEYLTIAFGDYMQLPDEAERLPKHPVAFVDLENSYLCYKGIKYCVPE
ncbi:MAG: LicD family protein [Eubacteriaceae bacterium]|nr:LicD family protein [Eubacteriaceae bacterium]